MLHSMRLHPRPFDNIKSGKKTSELRLNDEKRSAIKIGDMIEFTSRVNPDEKLVTKVT
ncbi:MAG TPA: ASCH domain-containing protein, partial [Patescibacteria group bacterium]